MRLSTNMMTNNSITGMLRKQTELANTSNQMGQGKRILTPSDDPVASAMAFNAKNKLADIEQYGKNIDYARKSMRTTESTLGNLHDRLQRVRQLAVAANNDTLGEDGRQTIGLEIAEITGQLEKLMNTRDESNNYIFAGGKSRTEPFVKQADGSYLYQGDTTEREIQVSDTTFISPFITGSSAFMDIDSTQQIRTYALDGNSSDEAIAVTGTAEYLEANQIGEYTLEFDGTDWSITTPHGQVLTDDSGNVITDLDGLENYVNSPLGTVDLTEPAGVQAGDKFVLMFDNPKEDLLTGMQRFERALLDFDGEQYQKDVINDTIAKADAWMNSIADARSVIGTRENGMDTHKANNEDLQLYLKENVSNLEDLDYAEATSRFVLQQTALTASQQTFSQISQLSLFNYIR
jgi:flagellar hook-associated protein 3 FlgL